MDALENLHTSHKALKQIRYIGGAGEYTEELERIRVRLMHIHYKLSKNKEAINYVEKKREKKSI